MTEARYDGHADWYDREFATSELGIFGRETVIRLLGPGREPCSTSAAVAVRMRSPSPSSAGRSPASTSRRISSGSRAPAGSTRGSGRAEELPFGAASFDAAVSMWTHTDVDDFTSEARELARVLRPGAPFVYFGAHPCFVGPHSRFLAGEGLPGLEPGYREEGRYDKAIAPEGIRARVGAVHLPLAPFLQAVVDAGFALERIEEPGHLEYPYTLALRWRR